MAPLAQQGRDANLIADLIKVLLDHQGQEYDAFTPITMDLPERNSSAALRSLRTALGNQL